ncbi:MAG: hypothetical protein KAH25_02280, partial [Bacteroidales bacterium]|nr:hypothetical protein [Bacteroidales bacterium]
TNSDNIYLGYRDIGLLKSIDGGISFKSAFTDEFNIVTTLLTITSIVIDPDSPNILYAASLYSSGMLYKSIDYGENWVVIDNGIPNTYIYKIALDKNSPTDSRILYVTSQGNGIYKTEDGGENWAPMNNGLGVDGNLNASSMIIDPNNSDILYAGFHEENTYGGSSETKQGGLFKSTNAGLSWTRMDNDLVQFRVSDIDIVSNNSQVIYTSVSGGYDHSLGITFSGGVYKSTDGGNSWSNMDNGFGTPFNLKMSSVAISPVDSNTLYAATNDAPYHDNASGLGIFKSVNGGENWETINEGLGLLRFNNLTINPQNPQVLYASSNGAGVFKGVDTDIVAVDDFFENIEYKIYPNPSNG